MVNVTVNGKSFEQPLPEGLGIQNADPAHLAFPATPEFEIPTGVLRPGKNMLESRSRTRVVHLGRPRVHFRPHRAT